MEAQEIYDLVEDTMLKACNVFKEAGLPYESASDVLHSLRDELVNTYYSEYLSLDGEDSFIEPALIVYKVYGEYPDYYMPVIHKLEEMREELRQLELATYQGRKELFASTALKMGGGNE